MVWINQPLTGLLSPPGAPGSGQEAGYCCSFPPINVGFLQVWIHRHLLSCSYHPIPGSKNVHLLKSIVSCLCLPPLVTYGFFRRHLQYKPSPPASIPPHTHTRAHAHIFGRPSVTTGLHLNWFFWLVVQGEKKVLYMRQSTN